MSETTAVELLHSKNAGLKTTKLGCFLSQPLGNHWVNIGPTQHWVILTHQNGLLFLPSHWDIRISPMLGQPSPFSWVSIGILSQPDGLFHPANSKHILVHIKTQYIS